jgi:hypothetical protein
VIGTVAALTRRVMHFPKMAVRVADAIPRDRLLES